MATSEEIQEAFQVKGFDVQVPTPRSVGDFMVICKKEDLVRLIHSLGAVRRVLCYEDAE